MTPLPATLLADLHAAADRAERDRRLPPELADALGRARLFASCVPRSQGGEERHPRELVEVLAAVAGADGSAGWCAMIAATSGVLAAWVPAATAREIWGDGGRATGGVFAPQGRAVVESGGFRMSGRWAFASGCQHCAWLMGGCIVMDGGEPRRLPSGAPDVHLLVFPAGDAEIIDTWTVAGLRGTGSHDIAVRELVVPAERAVSLVSDRPRESGALYAFPVFGLLALGIAGVALGIARGAIDELVRLATVKTPTLQRRRLADRAAVQADVAKAEAFLGGAWGFLHETIDEAWAAAETEGTIPVPLRARVRLAATHAVRSAAEAVDLMYEAGGGTSIYATSPLQRTFRDVHAVTQHLMVGSTTWEAVGRVVLGVDVDTSLI